MITGTNGRIAIVEGYVSNIIIQEDSILKAIEKIKVEGVTAIKVDEEIYTLNVIQHIGDLTITESTEYGTDEDLNVNGVVLKVEGNLTINPEVSVSPYVTVNGAPKGFYIYCTGTLTNNGIIENNRGANAGGQNVYLWKNSDGTYEYVPAYGGSRRWTVDLLMAGVQRDRME